MSYLDGEQGNAFGPHVPSVLPFFKLFPAFPRKLYCQFPTTTKTTNDQNGLRATWDLRCFKEFEFLFMEIEEKE